MFMHKMAVNFTNSNCVGVLALSKRAGSVHFQLWTQETNTEILDAYSNLILTSQVAIDQLSTKVFRVQIGFLTQVSQTNWDIYQHKFKTTKTVG